jgi:hypothetical protein
MTIDEQVEVLQAIKKGQKIEAQLKNKEGGWIPCDNKDLNFIAFDYRIVPVPRRWLIYTYQGKTFAAPYDNCLVSGATLICSAVEEPMPTQQHVNAFIQEVNKILTTPEPECSGSRLPRSK